MVVQGSDINLTCVAVGSPPPAISWTLDGQPTPYQTINNYTSPSANGCSTVIPGSTTSVLQITSIVTNGTYTCNATNLNGSSVQSVYIDVQGKLFLQYHLSPLLHHTLHYFSTPIPLALPLSLLPSSLLHSSHIFSGLTSPPYPPYPPPTVSSTNSAVFT